VVVDALTVEQPLGRLDLEGGQGGAQERVLLPEAEGRDDPERLHARLGHHPQLVTHPQAVLLRRGRVDRHLAVGRRRRALPDHERRRGRVPGAPDRGRVAALDRLAGGRVDQLGEPAHVAVDRGDPRHRSHVV
jgi:hypothetical protein